MSNDDLQTTPENTGAAQDLATVDKEKQAKLDKLRADGGASEPLRASFPALRLEHTTNFEGDANENKGKFTLTRKNPAGIEEVQVLGESIEIEILKQRYVLSLGQNNNKTKYSTREFDRDTKDNGVVRLYKREGDANDDLGEKPVHEWLSMFPNTTPTSKKRSDMWVLYVIYARFNGQIIKWKTNVSAMVAYGNYQRDVNVFGVTTKITSKEEKNGTNKYYVPVFEAVGEVKDLDAQSNDQDLLNDLLKEQEARFASPIDTVAEVFEGAEEVQVAPSDDLGLPFEGGGAK